MSICCPYHLAKNITSPPKPPTNTLPPIVS